MEDHGMSYTGLHVWAKNKLKKPDRCRHCKDEKSLDLANKSGEYNKDLNDWIWLCRKCHKQYDKKLAKSNRYSKSKLTKHLDKPTVQEVLGEIQLIDKGVLKDLYTFEAHNNEWKNIINQIDISKTCLAEIVWRNFTIKNLLEELTENKKIYNKYLTLRNPDVK